MSNAIIVHGCCGKDEFLSDQHPSLSNSHWIPWLQKQLVKAGIETQTPEMPMPYAPHYHDWARVFAQFTVTNETTLVGHSCGAGFLLRWLGENSVSVKNLFFVAPWLDPQKSRGSFLEFEISSSIQSRAREVHILVCPDDPKDGVRESVERIVLVLPKASVHRFEGFGHFTSNDMKSDRFPELLELIVQLR